MDPSATLVIPSATSPYPNRSLYFPLRFNTRPKQVRINLTQHERLQSSLRNIPTLSSLVPHLDPTMPLLSPAICRRASPTGSRSSGLLRVSTHQPCATRKTAQPFTRPSSISLHHSRCPPRPTRYRRYHHQPRATRYTSIISFPTTALKTPVSKDAICSHSHTTAHFFGSTPSTHTRPHSISINDTVQTHMLASLHPSHRQLRLQLHQCIH